MNTFHEIDSDPETNKHLAEIVESIKANGWQGLPLLAHGRNLLNGCHRATACKILRIKPEVHKVIARRNCKFPIGDSEYSGDLLTDLLENARDAQDVLAVLKAFLAEGLVDKMSVDIMQAEYDQEI